MLQKYVIKGYGLVQCYFPSAYLFEVVFVKCVCIWRTSVFFQFYGVLSKVIYNYSPPTPHFFLAHLSLRLKVSYFDHPPSVVVRLSVHNLYTTSPPKPLIGFSPNFTGMILGWSSFKVVQMVPIHCISRSQELKIDFLTKNLKNLLVRNHWTDFHIILQKCSFGDPLPRLFKPFGFVKKHGRQGAGVIFPILSI